MQKLLVVVMVAGACFGFYKLSNGDVDHPVHTYRQLMTHLRATEIGDAELLAYGDPAFEDIDAFVKHEARSAAR